MEIKDILFIEPFDGGSHKAFREGLAGRSRHRIECLTMPGRFWKWRMRGAAATFADRINEGPPRSVDLLLVTGFLNVADLKGLLHPPLDRAPIVLYMHENQLTYPLSPQEEFDFHFGFTNIISALASDHVVFNSAWHRDLFLEAVPVFLNKMPEAVPRRVAERLAPRCRVLPVGLDRKPLASDRFALYRGGPCEPGAGLPWPRGKRHRLIWNHRWEFDKRPGDFAAAVEALLDRGLDFEVALLGETAGNEEVFLPLRRRLGERCVAFGHLPSRADYDALLESGDIVVSCADQEYFGISVAEAVHAGCYPVLPRRQVYPSLYGSRCRGDHFYDTHEEFIDLLADLIGGDARGHVCSLDLDVDPFCWERLIGEFDEFLAAAAGAVPARGAPEREGFRP
ncbi:MAG: DUF3524 domain-containing protein [Candidatus Krumholzibacteriia bacterium]